MVHEEAQPLRLFSVREVERRRQASKSYSVWAVEDRWEQTPQTS